jgi:DNA-binding NarL/FixJ family response regulator
MSRNHLSHRPVVVIEDSDEDFEILLRGLQLAGVENPVHRCSEVDEVDALLAGPARWPKMLREHYPVLILLDLNFPGVLWQDLLRCVRANACLSPIPVVVITTSSQSSTVRDCYSFGAAGYIVKPLMPQTFFAAIKNLAAYWLTTVVAPVPPRQGTGRNPATWLPGHRTNPHDCRPPSTHSRLVRRLAHLSRVHSQLAGWHWR